MTTSLASNRSQAESPTTCGACASTGTVRSVVSVPGATLISRWETDLLRHLDREGLTVPVPVSMTARTTSCAASAAWEAAVCWDDEYAVKRLAEVRAV